MIVAENPTAGLSQQAAGYVGRIPVRNLWLLMLYGSDLFRMRGRSEVALEEMPDDLPDVVAEILASATEARQRRHLSLGYQLRHEVLSRVRGRIDVLTTERRQLLSRGAVSCRFDELTIDTPRNRFVRAALEMISKIVQRQEVAHRCRSLAGSMKASGVSGHAPTLREMSLDRFGRHDAEDRFMVAAARLAFDLALPTEAAGTNSLAMPEREEVWVRRLFEKAVGGFYRVVLDPLEWEVQRGGKLEWQIDHRTSGIDGMMPGMVTDVVLTHRLAAHRIVIDTKFTSILTKGRYQEATLRSGYIYQIYAYLRSQAGRGDPLADNATGLLLHPAIGERVDEAVAIQGHVLRFATVDLAGTAAEMREQLLRVTQPHLG